MGALIVAFILLVRRYRKEIEALEEIQAQLTRFIVHDIKNPLSCALSAISCVGTGDTPPESHRSLLNVALNSCRSGLVLSEKLLEVERLESMLLSLRWRKKDLQAGRQGDRVFMEVGDTGSGIPWRARRVCSPNSTGWRTGPAVCAARGWGCTSAAWWPRPTVGRSAWRALLGGGRASPWCCRR